MKRTIAYIDGYNLYYGLLQKNPESKWLDPVAFVKALLRSDHEIFRVKFFTARARPYPPDEAAVARQNAYLQAISADSRVQIVEGYLARVVQHECDHLEGIII